MCVYDAQKRARERDQEEANNKRITYSYKRLRTILEHIRFDSCVSAECIFICDHVSARERAYARIQVTTLTY